METAAILMGITSRPSISYRMALWLFVIIPKNIFRVDSLNSYKQVVTASEDEALRLYECSDSGRYVNDVSIS